MQEPNERRRSGSLSQNLSLASVFGGLYAVLVVVLAPISFLPFQVRFADALLPLAVLFGWPAALGLAIGAAAGNLVGDVLLGFSSASTGIDVVGGAVANLVACLVAWKIGDTRLSLFGKRGSWFLATVSETIIVSLIVGSYLGVILSLPLEVSILGVVLGSIVAINIVGYSLLRIVGLPKTIAALRSRGLAVPELRD